MRWTRWQPRRGWLQPGRRTARGGSPRCRAAPFSPVPSECANKGQHRDREHGDEGRVPGLIGDNDGRKHEAGGDGCAGDGSPGVGGAQLPGDQAEQSAQAHGPDGHRSRLRPPTSASRAPRRRPQRAARSAAPASIARPVSIFLRASIGSRLIVEQARRWSALGERFRLNCAASILAPAWADGVSWHREAEIKEAAQPGHGFTLCEQQLTCAAAVESKVVGNAVSPAL